MGNGPLSGVKIVEFANIGPVPFCGMLLSDMGAEIIRVDRKGDKGGSKFLVMSRNRRSVALDLKNPQGVETCLRLIESADVVLEGYRPGVLERLGLGPEICLARNPRLVYGRMTGWGQYGPLSKAAAHDINFIALTGALHAIGRPGEKPVMPLNLVGDFGGGALYLAMGICAALLEAKSSGKGQVIDSAMTDGAASLMAMYFGLKAEGEWSEAHGTNLLDGGPHFYDIYETSDGKWITVASLEPQFYALLREKAGLTDAIWDVQMDREKWPAQKVRIAEIFRTKTREEWCALMEGTDACFAPVLSMGEAYAHPHIRARESIIERDGVQQPNVAPRFSRTPSEIQGPPPMNGEQTRDVLKDWGFTASDIGELEKAGAI